MRIAVLAKYIPAPQGTPELGPDHLLVRTTADATLDPGDEYAVEAALRVAEAIGGEVTVLTMGPPEAVVAVRKAISMGAHAGVLISDPALRGADVLATARVLAAALRRGGYELVVGGVGASTPGGSSVTVNHLSVGRISAGATVERGVPLRYGYVPVPGERRVWGLTARLLCELAARCLDA